MVGVVIAVVVVLVVAVVVVLVVAVVVALVVAVVVVVVVVVVHLTSHPFFPLKTPSLSFLAQFFNRKQRFIFGTKVQYLQPEYFSHFLS